MNLGRFVSVLVILTLLSGAVGAAAGSLFGLAAKMPSQVTVTATADPSNDVQRDGVPVQGSGSVAVAAGQNVVAQGAAAGGGIGLLIGGGGGLLVALLDQLLLAVHRRKPSSQ